MAAPMTKRMRDALRKGYPLALLSEIDHPDGLEHYWTGIGELEYGGNTYTGTGFLGSISQVKYTAEIAIQEVALKIRGLPADVAAQLTEEVRNRQALIHLACLDPRGRVVSDPYEVVDGLMDYQAFTAGDDGTVEISVFLRTGFYTLERSIDQAWTPEEHKTLYPTDVGLDLIPVLQNQDLVWTRT
jgi:hypothetical protein